MNAFDNLTAWKTLVYLAEGKGFGTVCDHLGFDEAYFCRLIKKLEDEIGLRLTVAHSRPVRLTREARELLPKAKQLIKISEQLKADISVVRSVETTIRFGILVNVPRASLLKCINEHHKKDPKLHVQVLSDIDHIDILSGRAEIAYLPYRPEPEGLFIWDVAKSKTILMATPEYLEKNGVPRTPAELKSHNIIVRSARNYPHTTHLFHNGKPAKLVYQEKVFSGDVLSGKEVLLAGLGISIDLSITSCLQELQSGQLVPVLNGWTRQPWELSLVISRSHLSNTRLVEFGKAFAKIEQKECLLRNRRFFPEENDVFALSC